MIKKKPLFVGYNYFNLIPFIIIDLQITKNENQIIYKTNFSDYYIHSDIQYKMPKKPI